MTKYRVVEIKDGFRTIYKIEPAHFFGWFCDVFDGNSFDSKEDAIKYLKLMNVPETRTTVWEPDDPR